MLLSAPRKGGCATRSGLLEGSQWGGRKDDRVQSWRLHFRPLSSDLCQSSRQERIKKKKRRRPTGLSGVFLALSSKKET
ncbi:hypothetical protein E2320_007633, partial [Naja naja]